MLFVEYCRGEGFLDLDRLIFQAKSVLNVCFEVIIFLFLTTFVFVEQSTSAIIDFCILLSGTKTVICNIIME